MAMKKGKEEASKIFLQSPSLYVLALTLIFYSFFIKIRTTHSFIHSVIIPYYLE